jgi:hypothetical protein
MGIEYVKKCQVHLAKIFAKNREGVSIGWLYIEKRRDSIDFKE